MSRLPERTKEREAQERELFKSNICCIDHVLLLKMLVEKNNKNMKKLHEVFIKLESPYERGRNETEGGKTKKLGN